MPSKFHQQQYLVAGLLALVCLVMYNFAPPAKEAIYASQAALLVGFVVGKFSNGFKGGYSRKETPEEGKEKADV